MMTEEPDEMMADKAIALNQNDLFVLVLMGLVALVGLIGNLILLRSLFMYRNLRVDVYVITGGLGLADLIFMVIAVPAFIIDLLEVSKLTTTTWCKASRYITNASSYISAYHIVVLTVLRGILLTNRGHNTPTGRHAFYCSIVVWVIGALATVPIIQVWFSTDGYCDYTDDADQRKERWLTASFSCFVPLAMMLLIYLTTYYIGKRYFADSYSRHEKQMSRLVTAVMICFLVLELPYSVTDIYYFNYLTLHPDDEFVHTIHIMKEYFYCLILMDKALRPVLYSKLSTDLGECFDEIINCTYCHRYYSDGPKRQEADNNANSRAPLTTGPSTDTTATEEVVCSL